MLLQWIKKNYQQQFHLEIIELASFPLFSQNKKTSSYPIIQEVSQRIQSADGVLIACPEHNYTITSCLKSALEWLSYDLHPFFKKPVYIIGASYSPLGTGRSQLHLKEILQSPGLDAWVLPGNEFLLGYAREAFDEAGDIKDKATKEYFNTCLKHFLQFTSAVNGINTSISSQVDATSGASENYSSPSHLSQTNNIPLIENTRTPFDDILDNIFGTPRTQFNHTAFDNILDGLYPPKKKSHQPFEEVLNQVYGKVTTKIPTDAILVAWDNQ